MPIQAATQWTEYLNCPVCENGFDIKVRQPISLGCGHTICKTCLFNLQRNQCPFDLGVITVEVERLPINTALMLLIDSGSSSRNVASADLDFFRNSSDSQVISLMKIMENLALFLKPSASSNSSLSRSMQRKLITLINCQLMEDEGRLRASRAARSLGERTVTELILHHQNPQQLSANLWAAVRGRGCQFLGPAMQEEVLKLVLLALEDGEALSRKVLVMYVVQRLESQFPQASKTSIGHVVQLLYRASCFKVTKREGDSSLMQLKEEFRTYDTLRREHDMQIVQIATEAGLRIAPDQWSSLLYGDTLHKSQMQSIMDKLQTPESFSQSVQELVIALQKTGDPGKLTDLRPSLDFLAGIDPAQDTFLLSYETLSNALVSVNKVLTGLVAFVSLHSSKRSLINTTSSSSGNGGSGVQLGSSGNPSAGGGTSSGSRTDGRHHHHSRYKTNLCRDLSIYGFCPRGKNCTFAHSIAELEQYRSHRKNSNNNKVLRPSDSKTSTSLNSSSNPGSNNANTLSSSSGTTSSSLPSSASKSESSPFRGRQGPPANAPVAQVAPLPRVRKQSRTITTSPSGSSTGVGTPVLHPPSPSGAALALSSPNNGGGGAGHIQFHVLSDVYGNPVPYQHSGDGPASSSVIQYATTPQAHFHPFINGGERGGGGGSYKELLYSNEDKHLSTDISNEEMFSLKESAKQLDEEIVSKSIARIATKSLDALQTRKEEIIDTLEDLMGKDEVSKLSQEFEELSFQNQMIESSSGLSIIDKHVPTSNDVITSSNCEMDTSANSIYSMWTTKSIVSLETKNYAEAAAAVAQEQAIHKGHSNILNYPGNDEGEVVSILHHGIGFGIEEDIHPLPDVPLVSRFGPISRRCNTMLKPTNPSQTQATIEDDTLPTDMVTNTKQMTHQMPSMTSPWFYQNGIMSVQPVAVGPNGEVGYIVVADQPAPQPPVLIQNPIQPLLNPPEVEKISFKEECNTGGRPCGGERSSGGTETLSSSLSSSSGDSISSKHVSNSGISSFDPTPAGLNQIRQDQLSNELFLIENSIRDREREISINHMQEASISHHRGALDYGSYISQGLISTEEEDCSPRSMISFQPSTMVGISAYGTSTAAAAALQSHQVLGREFHYAT